MGIERKSRTKEVFHMKFLENVLGVNLLNQVKKRRDIKEQYSNRKTFLAKVTTVLKCSGRMERMEKKILVKKAYRTTAGVSTRRGLPKRG